MASETGGFARMGDSVAAPASKMGDDARMGDSAAALASKMGGDAHQSEPTRKSRDQAGSAAAKLRADGSVARLSGAKHSAVGRAGGAGGAGGIGGGGGVSVALQTPPFR